MINRRKFIQLGAAVATVPLSVRSAYAKATEVLKKGGEAYSHFSGTKLSPVPSICGQCPGQCAIIGYVDGGRVVKIEGQPGSIRNQGKICAKGQSGAQKIYDPDRILSPLRRIGKRGQGEWEKISWDVALNDLTARLQKLRDDGNPEKFVFHHGWIPASAEKLIDDVFLPAYGTASIVQQTCHGQSARWTAHELTWGGRVDNWDLDNTDFVLNFGSNVLEAHTNHVSLARRLALAAVDRRLRMVTFDVRLSNTAAKSDQWIPVKPGTDLAVALAMCNVVMNQDLYRGVGEAFLTFCQVTQDPNVPTADKITALKKHLAQYTPEWAEKISGVPAAQIVDIAAEFATAKRACVISSRGADAHFNGVETERAIQMLAAITGNIDSPGGRCRAIKPEWIYPAGPKDKPVAKKMVFIDDAENTSALSNFGTGHRVLNRIKAGGERPGVYMWYHHNPAYANGDTQEVIDILKDESLLPFTVAVTPFYDETAALADLILPDATYMERYDIDEGVSPNQVAEYAIRQPMIAPLGESRDFKDVCCDLAKRLGFPLGFKSAEKFVESACKLTPLVKKKARGFRRMKKKGVWHDKNVIPVYATYRNPVAAETLLAEEVIFDESTGVYWDWKAAGVSSKDEAQRQGYRLTANASAGYVGQKFGDTVYTGFNPGKINKSGYFELYSPLLAAKGLQGLPAYVAIPGHEELTKEQLILTTFKVNVQAQSNTGNDSWLAEIQHHNPAWINPVTAEQRGIIDGDVIKISSGIGETETTAKVTPTVVPGVLAMATHAGRWQGGRYASGKKSPFAIEDPRHDDLVWWTASGGQLNKIIPDNPEPISGQQSWMDTVVTVTRV